MAVRNENEPQIFLRKKTFQLFFDMIYGVNKIELGINDILQLIEVTLGEGELSKPTSTKVLNFQIIF